MDLRAESVIEKDRFCVAKQSVDIMERDIAAVLAEYFVLTDKPTLKIVKEKEKYKLSIEAECQSLKSIYNI